MRILITDKEEKRYRCPECKTLLAYTEDDIEELLKFIDEDTIEVRMSVDCPVCGYTQVLGFKRHNTKHYSKPLL